MSTKVRGQFKAKQEADQTSLYKTELCRSWEDTGFCRYGKKCQFAHSPKELRNVLRHPKYKTEMCDSFHTVGVCPYGNRCHFVHNDIEALRPAPNEPATKSTTLRKNATLASLQSNEFNYGIESDWPKIESSASMPVPASRSLNSIGSMNSIWRNQSDASILSQQESESSSSSNQYNDDYWQSIYDDFNGLQLITKPESTSYSPPSSKFDSVPSNGWSRTWNPTSTGAVPAAGSSSQSTLLEVSSKIWSADRLPVFRTLAKAQED
ncbi:Oidioi.mRNA.OKI2018_I69.XSR.g15760.t1.cds [Oikopleura dioica]|uniref:Oidioi.mRNA.OKI2018_I69.XSR.g15760.t1.cds n=1 Tax=Oikopleura dioica TaxID=34765 RepID=A0ABN7SFS8_OIKDI|nr:Oidioi.mRNA.OKI2018_I69.XSR.g15760.t1.cds [Oikopleura dioica]